MTPQQYIDRAAEAIERSPAAAQAYALLAIAILLTEGQTMPTSPHAAALGQYEYGVSDRG